MTSALFYAEDKGGLENTLFLGSLFSFPRVLVHLTLSNVQTTVFPIIKCLRGATVEHLGQLVIPYNIRMSGFKF